MAYNPFAQYGIKEVADVIVYDISGANPVPVMFFDSLKVSNVEVTAEETDARGGKGNSKLITWNYNKEIMLTLQDALLSMKSINLLLGPTTGSSFDYTVSKKIKKAEVALASVSGTTASFSLKYTPASTTGVYVIESGTTATLLTTTTNTYTVATTASTPNITNGQYVRLAYEVASLTTGGSHEIVITPDRFPGTYMFVGDTVIRNKSTGLDEGFQFIIPKAKIGSEISFTMEADGDPSVFDMNITVLKADNGTMMSLVRYDIGSVTSAVASNLT